MLRFFNILSPDEFAARQWRGFRRLKGWKSFPPVFAFTALLCGLFIARVLAEFRYGNAIGNYSAMVFLTMNIVPFLVTMMVGILWWTRPANRQTIVEISLSATPPEQWLRSSLRPVQVILVALQIVTTVPAAVLYLRYSTPQADDMVATFVITVNSFLASWFHAPVLWLMVLMIRSRIKAFFLAGIVLLLFHPLFLTVLLAMLGVISDGGSFVFFIVLSTLILAAEIICGVLAVKLFSDAMPGYLRRVLEG